MSITLCSWGAAEEVTGSKHILNISGKKILLDCGMFQGKRRQSREKNEALPFDASTVESLLLSHAHFDHCGSIPVLVKDGFNGNVYCTPATREIASLILMDSAHIQAKDAEYMTKKRAKKQDLDDSVPIKPIYNEDDVVRCLSNFVGVAYNRPIQVMDGVKATFYDAGHILGSSLIRLEINDNGKSVAIGFTGDLGRDHMAILRDPQTLPPVDYLICESTYGCRLHDEMDTAMEELAEVVNEVWENKGKLIIPAFSVGRTQELVYFFHLLHDAKKVPDIPIFVDSPMAVNATSIFRTHPECYDQETREAFLDHHKNPFGFETLRFVNSVHESKALNKSDQPMIIISASGMCEGGRILHHLRNNIGDPKNTILAVGFMAMHTLGRRIIEREKDVKIFGQKHRVKARIKTINAFSAHADYNEIKGWTRKLDRDRLKGVLLVHGENDAQENLSKVLLDDGIKRVESMKFGEELLLD